MFASADFFLFTACLYAASKICLVIGILYESQKCCCTSTRNNERTDKAHWCGSVLSNFVLLHFFGGRSVSVLSDFSLKQLSLPCIK